MYVYFYVAFWALSFIKKNSFENVGRFFLNRGRSQIRKNQRPNKKKKMRRRPTQLSNTSKAFLVIYDDSDYDFMNYDGGRLESKILEGWYNLNMLRSYSSLFKQLFSL